MKNPALAALAAALVAGAGGAGSRLARADGPSEEAGFATVLSERAASIVTVKFVSKQGESGGWESNVDARGVVVDASGLVMLSNGHFPGKALNIKVIFEAETKEHDAVLVAKDKLLDLAFVQILALEGHATSPVDLTKGGAVEVGRPLLGITRSGRGFDYAPEVGRLYATGRIEKPRPMWSIAGDFSESGLPVYDSSGKPVGVLSDQQGSEGAAEEGEGAESATCLLPLDTVLKSIEAAKKRVPEAVEKASETKEASDGAAMDGAAMDGGEGAGMDGGAKPPEPSPAPPPPPPPDPKDPKSDGARRLP